MKLLLTTIFKPYGKDDGYAEAVGMQMELFNNQITREQGVHSPRTNFWTFPLYFLAENTSVPATILDFPSWTDFVRELERGYTHIGISFIQTNVLKARRMAEYIRRHYPTMRIIIGGYGTVLPDIRTLVPCDEVCEGEGIAWMRRYFGEDPGQPIRHPIMHGVQRKHLYGIRTASDDSAVLFPGLGCRNACFFCSTSGKFSHQYIPILATGDDVYRTCCEAESTLGVREFAIIDENFLKDPARARRLLELMEASGKDYHFFAFASAETITELGIDFLVRLGVGGVWMGIETPKPMFEKMEGVDPHELVRDLQDNGITVISSSILFLEHHDRATLDREIDWAISVGSDMHQFMQLTPLPGTPLFEKYKAEGRLIPEFPYTRMSGQNALNFVHPHFQSEEAAEITRRAFARAYQANGPGVLGMAHTALKGYRRTRRRLEELRAAKLAWNPETLRYDRPAGTEADHHLAGRIEAMQMRCLELRPILTAARLYAPNTRVRDKAAGVAALYQQEFGPMTSLERMKASVVCASALVETIRLKYHAVLGLGEMVRQPLSRRIEYRQPQPSCSCCQ